MSIFQEFPQLFDRMNYITLKALFDREDEGVYPAWYGYRPTWEYRMYDTIKKARGDWTPNLLEKEDIEQEIYFIWLQCEKSQGGKLTERYLKQMTIWGIRDWTIRQSRVVEAYPYYYYFLEEKPEFLLDLSFLAYGTRVYPFSTLAPYERYLIFLRYREEKTILQISKVVCKNKNTVQRELRWILDKLRVLGENFEKENSGRSCSRGDGWASAKGECSEGCSPWNQATPPEAYQ